VLRALYRLVLALGGAAMAAFVVALLEARIVGAGVVLGGAPVAPAFGSLVLDDLGLLFPVAIGVASVVSMASLVLEPDDPKSPVAYVIELRGAPGAGRLRASAALPLGVLAVFAWCLGSAHAARSMLAAGKPAEAGLSVGLA
jgi:hypothetical protein